MCFEAQRQCLARPHMFDRVAGAVLAARSREHDQILERYAGMDRVGGQVEHLEKVGIPVQQLQFGVEHADALRQVVEHAAQVGDLQLGGQRGVRGLMRHGG